MVILGSRDLSDVLTSKPFLLEDKGLASDPSSYLAATHSFTGTNCDVFAYFPSLQQPAETREFLLNRQTNIDKNRTKITQNLDVLKVKRDLLSTELKTLEGEKKEKDRIIKSIRKTLTILESDLNKEIKRGNGSGFIANGLRAAIKKENQILKGEVFRSRQLNPNILTQSENVISIKRRQVNNITNEIKAIDESLNRNRPLQSNESATNKKVFFQLGDLQTLSISSQRTVTPVRRLGTSYPTQYVRGPRTFAGSMIFTLFNGEALLAMARMSSAKEPGNERYTVDKLPPFNIIYVFNTELGGLAFGQLLDVTITNDGMVISVDNIFTEMTLSYVACRRVPLTTGTEKDRKMTTEQFLNGQFVGPQVDPLLFGRIEKVLPPLKIKKR